MITYDESSSVLSQDDLAVTLDVIPQATLSHDSLGVGWIETEGPTSTHVSVNHDARQAPQEATLDVPWLSMVRTGDDLALGANAQSAALVQPGVYTAGLTVHLSLDGRDQVLALPIVATVGRALSGPSLLAPSVDATSTEAALPTELTSVDLGRDGIGRSAVHPHGGIVFVVSESKFRVVDVP